MPTDERIDLAADRPSKASFGERAASTGFSPPASIQLSLFDVADDDGAQSGVEIVPAAASPKAVAARPASKCADAGVVDQRLSRIIGVADMPAYSDDAHERAAAALRSLPQTQVWFTYKDIEFFFGVSRATVVRRLREGLVPGVRLAGSSVVEDAPVRRFDRGQLKWVLLALRHRRRQQGRSGGVE